MSMFSPIIKKSLTAAAAGSIWIASASTAFAEEKQKRTKLSIYDDPEPEVVIIESPTKLEEQVHIATKYANETVNEGKNRVDGFVKKYQDLEHQVTTDITSTIDKDEEILPNLLYVGVAALGGTILARRRNIVLRFLTSTALAVGASYYFLPKTTHNVALRLEKFEQRYPQLVDLHQQFNSTVTDARKQVDNTVSQLTGGLREQIEVNTNKVKEQLNTAEKASEDKFEQVKKNVESMYTTRSKPGVDETLKKSE